MADSFNENGGAGWSPTRYIKVLMWGADPAYASGGTGYTLSHQPNMRLSSCWFESALGNNGPGPAVIVEEGDDTGGAQMGCFVERDTWQDDCVVTTRFEPMSDNRGRIADVNGVLYAGVCARVGGGSLNNPADQDVEYYNAVDGYAFVRIARKGGNEGRKFYLLRTNGGVLTRLTDSPLGNPGTPDFSVDPYSTVEDGEPFELRMTVTGTSAPVNIVCEYRQLDRRGGEPDPEWTEVFDYDDDDGGDEITASGRCGFMSTKVITTTEAGYTARGITKVRIDNGSGSKQFEDYFERMNLSLADPITCESGRTGYSLASAWVGDSQSHPSVVTAPGQMSFGTDALNIGAADPAERLFLSQTPPIDESIHDSEIDVTFLSTGTIDPADYRSAGVFARGQFSRTDTGLQSGYLGEVRYNGTIFEYCVTRYVNGVPLLLCRKTVALSLATEYTLRVLVTRIRDVNGPVGITGFIDGSEILGLDLEAGLPSGFRVTEISDQETVIDGTASRLVAGGGKGIYVYNPSAGGANRAIKVDAWGTGATEAAVALPVDQASIALPTEASGASGTLSARVGAVEVTRRRDVTGKLTEQERAYRALRGSKERRVWSCATAAATTEEMEALVAFHDGQGGEETPFSWTTHEGEAVTARFLGDTLTVVKIGPGVWSYEFALEEAKS